MPVNDIPGVFSPFSRSALSNASTIVTREDLEKTKADLLQTVRGLHSSREATERLERNVDTTLLILFGILHAGAALSLLEEIQENPLSIGQQFSSHQVFSPQEPPAASPTPMVIYDRRIPHPSAPHRMETEKQVILPKSAESAVDHQAIRESLQLPKDTSLVIYYVEEDLFTQLQEQLEELVKNIKDLETLLGTQKNAKTKQTSSTERHTYGSDKSAERATEKKPTDPALYSGSKPLTQAEIQKLEEEAYEQERLRKKQLIEEDNAARQITKEAIDSEIGI